MKTKDGKMVCPVCKGTGKVTEDSAVYTFITRDPITEKCMICNGSGRIGPRKILPDGRGVYELAVKRGVRSHSKGDDPNTSPSRLNVSKKTPPKVGGTSCRTPDPTSPSPHLATSRNLTILPNKSYYLSVYRLIRHEERIQGTWTLQDEEGYSSALEFALALQNSPKLPRHLATSTTSPSGHLTTSPKKGGLNG